MTLSAFISLSLLGTCLAATLEMEPLSDQQIFYINSVQLSWTAGRNFEPEEFESVKRLLGVNITASRLHRQMNPIPASNAKIRDDLPKEFDSRQKWPHCKSINEIRDQSKCGDCWAFGTAEAMTDRMCIHTQTPVHISAEDLNDCVAGYGCDGGFQQVAWDFMRRNGVVSGGNYNSNEGCMPYSLPHCGRGAHSKYKPCQHSFPTPKCTKKCREGYGKTYQEDKHYAQGVNFFNSEEQIMQEIVDNGPVSAEMKVYEDFYSYKSGIYKHTTGKELGGHTIKIIGYGEEDGQKYWFVANSWNEEWGDKGFFKIAKGSGECGIENNAQAALPKK